MFALSNNNKKNILNCKIKKNSFQLISQKKAEKYQVWMKKNLSSRISSHGVYAFSVKNKKINKQVNKNKQQTNFFMCMKNRRKLGDWVLSDWVWGNISLFRHIRE